MNVWQAGIDLHATGFYAVILQRQRYGWQLRNWHRWHEPPQKEDNTTFPRCGLFSPELVQALRSWRRLLPKRISFRIALPAEAILQQTLSLPHGVESTAARRWLIDDSIDRLFPLSAQELTVDYQIVSSTLNDGKEGAKAIVSATRKGEMALLLSCLSDAGITPDIVDAVPCVLRSAAQAAGVERDALLLHRTARRFMWVSPLNDAFCYQLLPEGDGTTTVYISQAKEAYRLMGGNVTRVRLSGEIDEREAREAHIDTQLWSPLAAIGQMSPPLPSEAYRFALACGLALRGEDSECCR